MTSTPHDEYFGNQNYSQFNKVTTKKQKSEHLKPLNIIQIRCYKYIDLM